MKTKLNLAVLFLSLGGCGFLMAQNQSKVETATFAGGCFWGTENYFLVPKNIDTRGILSTVVGYTGDNRPNVSAASATYEEVSNGKNDLVETVQIKYDPNILSYEDLLNAFFNMHDPTTQDRQGNDVGRQYRWAIFYHNVAQKVLAEEKIKQVQGSKLWGTDKKIVTEVQPAGNFYRGEEYHQKYLAKNPNGYDNHFNRHFNFGPKLKLKQGKAIMNKLEMDKNEKMKRVEKLNPNQRDVTQNEGTEPPFRNEYWNNHRQGIYVDIVSGEPLFSSTDKFDSGTGWPSFTKPLDKGNIREKTDHKMSFEERTEVRSKVADSHLGHVFKDGPDAKTGNLRYCINSASLRFIPQEELEKEGFGHYSHLFDQSNNKSK